MCIPCELYQSYLYKSNNFTKSNFYAEDSVQAKIMLNDLYQEAAKHNIYIFKMVYIADSVLMSHIDIYSDDTTKRILIDENELYSGNHESIFSGRTNVRFYNFKDIPFELLYKDPSFQFIGEIDNIRNYKSKLINKYGGGYPQINTYYPKKESQKIIVICWTLFTIILCVLTYYEILMYKKEAFVRITMGERLSSIYISYLLSEIMYMLFLFFLSFALTQMIYHIHFQFKLVLVLFFASLVADLLVSLFLLNIEPQEAVSGYTLSLRLLIYNYVVKAASIIMSSVIISLCLYNILGCIQYYNQKDIYEKYKDYCMVSRILDYKTNRPNFDLQGDFYKEFFSELDIIYSYQCIQLNDTNHTVAIQANKNALVLVSDKIPFLQGQQLESDIYIIKPQNLDISDDTLMSLKSSMVNASYEIIEYRNDIQVFTVPIGESDNTVTKLEKNPVIIYHNTDYCQLYTEHEVALSVNLSACIIKDSVKIDEYFASKECKFVKSNMMDVFESHWKQLKRTLYLYMIISAFLIAIQVLILYCIVKLEYTVNAVELSIKKLVGYTLFQRFQCQILISGLLFFFCFIALQVIDQVSQVGNLFCNFVSLLTMLLLDTIVFTMLVRKYDKARIPKILKGGAL